MSGTDRIIVELVAMAIERDRIILRAQIEALPSFNDDMLYVKKRVLALLNAPTIRESEKIAGPLGSQTVAASSE